MKTKTPGFQFEVRLGLALIILVLVILNFASHYALFRIKQSLEDQIRNELTEAAVVVADGISRTEVTSLADTAISHITNAYSLDSVAVIPLSYERVMAINDGHKPDSEMLQIDSSITAEELAPILRNKPTFIHKRGSKKSALLFPIESIGSKYIIAVTRENTILSSVENAGAILIFFGLLGISIIVYVSARFTHFITNPFERLREKAVESGHMDVASSNQVSALIKSYDGIIDDLKQKELDLLHLNEIITRRAEDLEVYNNYILKSINTGIIAIDNSHRISSLNRAAADILELQDINAIGEEYSKLFAEFQGLQELIEDFLRNHRPIINSKVMIKTRCGLSRTLSVSLFSLSDSCGQWIGLSLILNDQTEFLKMQEELELNRRMASLGEMSGGLAHQLRNSTAAIIGLAKLIEKRIPENCRAGENMHLLLKEAAESSALVGRFLDFARPLYLEAIDINLIDVLEEIIVTAKQRYPALEILFENISRGQVNISADSLLLKQAIGNIIDNACLAAGEKGEHVKINLRIAGEMAEAIISDNGPGIPENIRESIFTPFFSGTPSGSGLGLPLARKIIALHGGRVEFDSQVGNGTTFTVSLPLKKAQLMGDKAANSAVLSS